jgi:hypothetical protein
MTQAEFVRLVRANPYAFPLPCNKVPAEWWAEVWRIDRVRDALSSDLARTVSKEGKLGSATGTLTCWHGHSRRSNSPSCTCSSVTSRSGSNPSGDRSLNPSSRPA